MQCTSVLRPLVCGWCSRYHLRQKTCKKCAVPECEIEDVVACLAPLMTQAPRAGHHVACPRTGTTQQQGQQQQEQQNGGPRPPCSISMKHTNTTRTHLHARTLTYTHAHARARAYARTHTQSCSHTHIHTHANVRTHKHAHTHIIIEATRWDKVFVEEGVGAAILSPKFEWPWSYRPF